MSIGIPALNHAIDETIDAQTEKLAIQRRFVSDMREIWGLQPASNAGPGAHRSDWSITCAFVPVMISCFCVRPLMRFRWRWAIGGPPFAGERGRARAGRRSRTGERVDVGDRQSTAPTARPQ